MRQYHEILWTEFDLVQPLSMILEMGNAGESERNSPCFANQTSLMSGRKRCKFKMMNVLNMVP